ncbi:hypothetical protein LINPERHAP2_LOCUS33488, partial [Linum perenne]
KKTHDFLSTLRTPRRPPPNSLIGRPLHALLGRSCTPSSAAPSHALLGRRRTPSSAVVARPPRPPSHALLGRRRTPSLAALHTPRQPPLNVSSVALGSSVAAARLHDCHP